MLERGNRFRLGPFEVNGFSTASRCSWYVVPALEAIFDIGWCIEPMRNINTVFLSHLHQDHGLALTTWLGWRQDRLAEGEPRVFVPRAAVDATRAWIDAVAHGENAAFKYSVHGLAEGDRVPLTRDYVLEAFETPHWVPTVGFLVWKRRRRLQPAFQGRSGAEIAAALKAGEAVHVDDEVPVLCYTSDTTPELFDRRPDLLRAQVLITECSYLDGSLDYRPDDPSRLGELPVTHCHIRPLARRLAAFSGEVLALGHVPRKYEACDLRAFLLPRLPPSQRDKLVVVPYQAEPPTRALIACAPPPRPEAPPAVPLERLAPAAWVLRERPGPFGRHKARELTRLAQSYPGFRLAWSWEQGYVSQRAALQLYEDAYCAFLESNPQLVRWLVDRAADVYDTDPRNVAAGLDYDAQAADAPNHYQDIAIRRSLLRLGTWFRGAALLEVRTLRSEGYVLNPGVVPFHRPELIHAPERADDWILPGSIESFWQSNKVVLTPATDPH